MTSHDAEGHFESGRPDGEAHPRRHRAQHHGSDEGEQRDSDGSAQQPWLCDTRGSIAIDASIRNRNGGGLATGLYPIPQMPLWLIESRSPATDTPAW